MRLKLKERWTPKVREKKQRVKKQIRKRNPVKVPPRLGPQQLKNLLTRTLLKL